MSLSFNFKNCKGISNEEGKITDEEVLRYKDCLVWGTLTIGLGSITEKNKHEWFFRLRFAELNDMGLVAGNVPFPFSVIEKCVGFTCNVSPKTRSQFLKFISKIQEDRVVNVTNKELENDTKSKL